MPPLFGIDLGGTKIEGVVLPDAETPEPLARLRIETEAEQGYAHVLGRISELVGMLEHETGLQANRVGIGTPGSTNPVTGLMRNSNSTCLNGMPFHRDLREKLGREVRMANDANCFALAEAKWGAAKGYPTVFGIILGTGVGGGLVVEGRALEGANGIAGEWGHNILDASGSECYCGRKGCVETFLCGPANERAYRARTGERRSLAEIAERAREGGDPDAEIQIENLCANFGRAVATVVNVFDPHAIVLGGGVGQVDELYDRGREACRPWVFSDQFDTPFLRPALGDSAGVFGAALL